jgi:ABC-type glutathione transport system ATPase component
MSEPLVTIRELSNAYRSRAYGVFGRETVKPVLNHISLAIQAGEIVGAPCNLARKIGIYMLNHKKR